MPAPGGLATVFGEAVRLAVSQAFHDITTGDNTVSFTSPPATVTGYQAGPGWDPVTGWGTPNAHVLVPLLAR